jgi:hypothetical protein
MTRTQFPALVSPLEASPDGYAGAHCPACGGGEFGFHQPDTRKPDRLLAVCDGCGEWFLFELGASLIVQIPSVAGLSPTRH